MKLYKNSITQKVLINLKEDVTNLNSIDSMPVSDSQKEKYKNELVRISSILNNIANNSTFNNLIMEDFKELANLISIVNNIKDKYN